jgi:nucleotide-binding universal stress UspA family protein
MSTDSNRPIMVAYDFSDDGRAALDYGLSLADQLDRDIRVVHVAQVLEPTGPTIMPPAAVRHRIRRTRAALAEIAQAAELMHPSVRLRTAVLIGEPSEVLVRQSMTASLTVVGARGLGGHPSLRWGSVSNRLVARGSGTVIIVRSSTDEKVPAIDGPIVVLADTGASGAATLDAAALLERATMTYIVTAGVDRTTGRVVVECGGLPLDRVIIRVPNDRPDAVDLVGHIAADYHARLVVVTRERHPWPFRFGHGSPIHRLADSVECPLAVVEMRAVTPVESRRAAPEHVCATRS